MPPEKGLRPIPSVIDFPSRLEVDPHKAAATSARPGSQTAARSLLLRGGKRRGELGKGGGESPVYPEKEPWASETQSLKKEPVKHYDADGEQAAAWFWLLHARGMVVDGSLHFTSLQF